ncbi:MAG TPA: cysteine--tRNA ligase [Rhizomicrobium sp.]|nr:cysteine--tRNA ligase [Rhizomicrobium sp.]
MNLRLYNTLSRTKEDFTPLDPKKVRLYVCGPTVYDFAHIGNARPVIVFDVLFRLLRHIYGEAHVTYVRNITDIDDKINARAASEGVSIREVTEKTARQYLDDVTALGCLAPTHTPRATEHIPEMIAMIGQLINAGFAYPAEGHVLFDVGKKKDYGKLARRSLDEMIAGARVDVAPYKKNPMDFVLWKPSDAATPGWDSPWGRGRPGWHIECSAMSEALLGETFDIHGGGIDLVFPHHENEIAQSEGAHGGHPLARYWMHNGFLNVEGEKMSKSLGNFVTINELLEYWPGDAIRFNMLKTNYAQPMDWTNDGVINSMNELRVWTEFVAIQLGECADLNLVQGGIDPKLLDHLSDNLNTHMALGRLGEMFDEVRQNGRGLENFVKTAQFMGFRHLNKPGFFDLGFAGNLVESGPQLTSEDEMRVVSYRASVANTSLSSTVSENKLDELAKKGFVIEINEAGVLSISNTTSADFEAMINERIKERLAAKRAKDYKKADEIRSDLLRLNNIELEDHPDNSTTWRVKR